jgi:predicted nucleotidyltransferase
MKLDQQKIERIRELARAYGAKRLILFGSALDSSVEAHDIDLGCDGIEGWKLYEFAGRLENELRVSLDLIPLTPATYLTRKIERQGRILL